MTSDNRDKFSYIADRYNQLVKFYNVEELCAEKLKELIALVPAITTSRVSVGAFYRLLTPWLLAPQIDKVIYLDSDIIVNLDINELWQIDLQGKVLAAAPEVEVDYLYYPKNVPKKYLVNNNLVAYNDYFNSGVMLMNLKYLRAVEEFIMKGVAWRGEHPQCNCFDQDILNYLFSKDYIKLPEKFGVFVTDERLTPERQGQIRNANYHYVRFSLKLEMSDVFNRLWMSYFMKTPWFGAETLGGLYSGFQQIYANFDANSRYTLIRFSAMMSGKARAFFMRPQNVDQLKELFSIRDDEDIILDENQESLQNLVTALRVAQGKKIFFIMVPNFPFDLLTQIGFVANKDFLNGLELLAEARAINSHSLIKEM